MHLTAQDLAAAELRYATAAAGRKNNATAAVGALMKKSDCIESDCMLISSFKSSAASDIKGRYSKPRVISTAAAEGVTLALNRSSRSSSSRSSDPCLKQQQQQKKKLPLPYRRLTLCCAA